MGRAGKKIDLPTGISTRESGGRTRIQVAFTWQGRPRRELLKLDATAANVRYATGLRNEILGKIERGTFIYADYFPRSPAAQIAPQGSTVAAMLDRFKKQCDKAVRNKSMSHTTVDSYRKNIENHLKPAFGKLLLRELTAAHIRDFIRGLDLTAKTIKNILVPLSQMLDEAVNDEVIESSPMARVKTKQLIKKNARPSTYKIDPFTPEEIDALLKSAKDQARNLFQFGFESGLRISELIALRWEDVDLERRLVYVCRAVVDGVEKTTKTEGSTRYVELTPKAVSALVAQRQWTVLQRARVFHNPVTGEPYNHDQQVRKSVWTPALTAAALRYRGPGQMRHTFASAHVSRGANLYWLKDQMGHETLEMIQQHYAKWMPEYARPERSPDARSV